MIGMTSIQHHSVQGTDPALDSLPLPITSPSATQESKSTILPKTKFLNVAAPSWINKMRADLTAPGSSRATLTRGEIADFPADEQTSIKEWVSKKAFHQFGHEDPRYLTLAATKAVIDARAASPLPNEKIFVAAIRYLGPLGTPHFKPVSCVSLVQYDAPKMPEFGESWGADFVTKNRYQGRGLMTGLVNDYLKPAADTQEPNTGGFKPYSEPHDTGLYDHLKLHKGPDKKIDDLDNPGEKLDVTIFSSLPLPSTQVEQK